MEDDLQGKTTFDGRQYLMEDDLPWKTTFAGRQPSMKDELRWKATFDGKQPTMENNQRWKTTSMEFLGCLLIFFQSLTTLLGAYIHLMSCTSLDGPDRRIS